MAEDKPFLFNSIFQFQNLESLEENSDDYKKNKIIETEFTKLVDVMRDYDHLPHHEVNKLMTLFWRLVGNRITPVALTESVPTIGFFCEIHKRHFVPRSVGLVFVPSNWHQLLMANPLKQMGAMVFVASQAKDYWNHRFLPPNDREEVTSRAHSNEAELLHYFSRTVPDFKPDAYQKHVMEKYSFGTKSLATNYVGRDFDGVFPPFPIDEELIK